MDTVVYHPKMKQRCALWFSVKASTVLNIFLEKHTKCTGDVFISFSDVSLSMDIKITLSGITKKSLRFLTKELKKSFPKHKITLMSSNTEKHLYRIA